MLPVAGINGWQLNVSDFAEGELADALGQYKEDFEIALERLGPVNVPTPSQVMFTNNHYVVKMVSISESSRLILPVFMTVKRSRYLLRFTVCVYAYEDINDNCIPM